MTEAPAMVAEPCVALQVLVDVAVGPEMPITGSPGSPMVARWTAAVGVDVPGASVVVTLAHSREVLVMDQT
ncbi:hypothetical protein ACWEQP_32205 [Streptomyces sp. NPDC004044]